MRPYRKKKQTSSFGKVILLLLIYIEFTLS